MSWQNVPTCDACWTKVNHGREPYRMAEPFREVHNCHDCGQETLSGIYVRRYVRDDGRGDE